MLEDERKEACHHVALNLELRRVGRDFGRLTTLGSEGRSTATTVMSLAAIRELVTDEAAELRPLGRRPHVGDDKNTHLMLIVHVVAVDPRNATLQAAVCAVPKPLGAPMAYRLQGRIHATFYRAVVRLSSPSGQGTVEYVALILLVAGVLAGVIVAATLSPALSTKRRLSSAE